VWSRRACFPYPACPARAAGADASLFAGYARAGDAGGLFFTSPQEPKSGILLPLGAVPGLGVLSGALFARNDTPKRHAPEISQFTLQALRRKQGSLPPGQAARPLTGRLAGEYRPN
jgi:hypothetical protein